MGQHVDVGGMPSEGDLIQPLLCQDRQFLRGQVSKITMAVEWAYSQTDSETDSEMHNTPNFAVPSVSLCEDRRSLTFLGGSSCCNDMHAIQDFCGFPGNYIKGNKEIVRKLLYLAPATGQRCTSFACHNTDKGTNRSKRPKLCHLQP
jgi:hypothetical protein